MIDKDKKYFYLVKRHMDKLNPYGLLPDAPKDEFDGETEMIVEEMEDDYTEEAIANIIESVLMKQFGIETCKKEKINECAKRIYNDLRTDALARYKYLDEKYPILLKMKGQGEKNIKYEKAKSFQDDEKEPIKLIDVIKSEYVSFTEKDKYQDIIAKYIELVEDGKKNGYTPIIMYNDESLINYFSRYNLPYKKENYKTLVEKLIEDSQKYNGEELWNTIMEQYFLESCIDDEDRYRTIKYQLEEPDMAYDFSSYKAYEIARQNEVKIKDVVLKEADFDGYANSSLIIVKIPTNKPYEVVAWIPFGNFNWCPAPKYNVAVARYFYEKYGAIPMGIFGYSIDYYLPKPITDKELAKSVAKEFVIYDDDEYPDLAGSYKYVLGAKSWHFWWD